MNNLCKRQEIGFITVEDILTLIQKKHFLNIPSQKISWDTDFIDKILNNKFEQPPFICLEQDDNSAFIKEGISNIDNLYHFSLNSESFFDALSYYFNHYYDEEIKNQFNSLSDFEKNTILFNFLKFKFVFSLG